MHPIPPGGCHKLPPPPVPLTARESGGDGAPDLLVHLTARVRFWIVAGWLPREEAA